MITRAPRRESIRREPTHELANCGGERRRGSESGADSWKGLCGGGVLSFLLGVACGSEMRKKLRWRLAERLPACEQKA